MLAYIVALFLAMGSTAAITPAVIRLARAADLLDRPGLRKAHRHSVPRLGGVAIACGVIVAIACLGAKGSSITWSVRDNWPQWAAFVLGAIMVFALGLIDDIRNLRATTKLLIQFVAASLVCAFGIRLDTLRLDEHMVIRLGAYAWPITILWTIGITNAVNLIDGLDGLAAGITAIAALVIASLAMTGEQPALALVMITVTGSLLGFLFFNFHPARIFLGDCGAMSLGFLLAIASVRSASITGRVIDIALPALALVLPILDTLHCIVRRRVERRSVFSSDRGHIHHRLLDIGFSQRGVSVVLYAITAMSCGLGLLMLFARGAAVVVTFVCVFLLVLQLLKAIGALPLRENVLALHRNRAITQRASRDRQAFETSRLRFEGVRCLDEWWTALCAAAADMRLARIVLWSAEPSGRSDYREWQADEVLLTDRLRTTLLLRTVADAPPAMLEVEAPVDGAFESASCRVQFFARLIDENDPASLPGTATEASRREPAPASDGGGSAARDRSSDGAPREDGVLVYSGAAEDD
jgi:UDP-N-acetylmuramyl pentapeptide phosphotransferase/UDP-N-acetylglucosamine-1-phosphate transferase